MKKFFSKLYIILIFIFLYAPIATLIVLSFNKSKTRAKWGGFTLKWYSELFDNQVIMACVAISRMHRVWRTFFMGVTNIPMLNADIVTGISLMLLYLSLGMTFGFTTILLAHITFNIPYVILSVMPKMKQVNRSAYEAALDLGASHPYAFFKVVFPDLLPGIFTGFLMAFTMSLDDFIITHFTKGPGVDTLSTKIYTEVKKGIKPEMYALSTIIFVAVLLLLLFINKKPGKKDIA